jgi:hypothetical protein
LYAPRQRTPARRVDLIGISSIVAISWIVALTAATTHVVALEFAAVPRTGHSWPR